MTTDKTYDLFIIGGGINGCGIARDAAGRGLSVALAEMDDLASATSSASTKLFHGGLRYLEYFEIGLVRKALKEREILLQAMPHISWPMRFVLPVHKDMRFEGGTPTSRLLGVFMPWLRGRRPDWLIRLGLFMYDHLGGRKILPGTKTLRLQDDIAGSPLQDKYKKAFEYSDCWVEDSRLVVLNACDAQMRGATIMTRSKMMAADRVNGIWHLKIEDQISGQVSEFKAKMLINAAGPWVEDIIVNTVKLTKSAGIRLVRGSHIVTKRLYDHDKCYFFQGQDGRIIFAIPYEGDFTLIGTTDAEHTDLTQKPVCTQAESDYLRKFASEYFKKPVEAEDIVWTYAGVRPLYDDGASSASAATRDYVLTVRSDDGAPLLSVFGGKITTYRRLAESVLAKVMPFFPGLSSDWTAGVPLPGGDFPVNGVPALIAKLSQKFAFLDDIWARRLIRAYGTLAFDVLEGAKSLTDLGTYFGKNLTECEVRWLMKNEFAITADDVIWRRSKLGLRMSDAEKEKLKNWMDDAKRL
ncbi:MAG: glycerol-3-phosphate dehydrogenase [Rhodobacteraceae bacterium]|nr:glycerol-3-phosphate dehydrogenase [Paracoccaceae bacterium]